MDSHNQSQNFLKQLESFFDTYLHKKVPFHLPANVKEWIVQFGPWISLVLIILAVPAILLALGIGAFASPFVMMYGGYHYSGYFMLHGLISLGVLALEAAALPGLFKRSLSAWHLVFYAALLSAVGELLIGNLFGLIIGTAISMYFLFQIREYYH